MLLSDSVLLASEHSTLAESAQYVSIFWITLAAFISPLLSRLLRKRIPDVVFLLLFGMLIGPNVLNLAGTQGGIPLLKELGLGMLFLIAGFEINAQSLRSRQGGSAVLTWFVCFGLGLLGAASITGFAMNVYTYVAIAVALSSTALGTLLPMLKSNGAAGTRVGNAVLVQGAVGELFPIFAMSLLLSSHSPGAALLILLAFMAVAIITALVPHHLFTRIPGLRALIAAEANTTGQTVLRLAMLLLGTLTMCTALFDLDAVLGAFAAGIILRSLTPGSALHLVTRRLETAGFSFLIPLFFVVSGMGINPAAVTANPLGLIAVVVGILLVRGLPVFLAEMFFNTASGLETKNERAQLALYSAAGLPIIVAVTSVATASDLMKEQTASLLVAGGAMTVLLFPLWAAAINRLLPAQAPTSSEPSRREQIAALKAKKNSEVKLSTGMIPVVELKSAASEPQAQDDAQPQRNSTGSQKNK